MNSAARGLALGRWLKILNLTRGHSDHRNPAQWVRGADGCRQAVLSQGGFWMQGAGCPALPILAAPNLFYLPPGTMFTVSVPWMGCPP